MPADVYVSARTAFHPAGDPIENVFVSLHTTAGAFLTSGFTDVAGLVFLGNRADDTYEVRITPPAPGTVVSGNDNRQAIVVINSAAPLAFDVVIDVSTLDPAQDVNFCRCSGYFIDDSGQPCRNMPIMFDATDTTPNLLCTVAGVARGVIPHTVKTLTDDAGFAVIDLIREQVYHVNIGLYDDISWDVFIPNLPAAPLPDVVLPYPSVVEYRDALDALLLPLDAPTISVVQGTELSLSLTTAFSSGVSLVGMQGVSIQADTAHYRLQYSISDHKLVLCGLSPGDVVLSLLLTAPSTAGYGIRAYPAKVFTGNLTVTVVDDPGIPDLVDPGNGDLGPIISDVAP